MRILIADEFAGYGYGTLVSQRLAHGLKAAGATVAILNLRESRANADYKRQRGRCDLLISFSGRALALNRETYIHRDLGIPAFCPFGDHPFYKMEMIDFTMSDVIYGFNDSYHQHLLQRMFPSNASNYIHFPHFPIFSLSHIHDSTSAEPRARRIYFAGSANVMYRDWALQPSKIFVNSRFRQVYEEHGIISRIDEELGNNLFDLPGYLYDNFYHILENEAFRQIFMEADIYLRSKRRFQILSWLSEELPITLIGFGWKHVPFFQKNSNVEVLKPQPYVAAETTVRRRYTVGLNIFQNQINGPHDRIFNTASAAQILVSDENLFLKRLLGECSLPIFTFSKHSVVTACSNALSRNDCCLTDGLRRALQSQKDLTLKASVAKILKML